MCICIPDVGLEPDKDDKGICKCDAENNFIWNGENCVCDADKGLIDDGQQRYQTMRPYSEYPGIQILSSQSMEMLLFGGLWFI